MKELIKARGCSKKPSPGHQRIPPCRGYTPKTPARTEEALKRLTELFNEAVKILSELAHIERLLVELKRKVCGKDPQEFGEKPTQFLYGARPRSSSSPSGRAKDRVEDRAISSAFQKRSVHDLVPCPNHGAYPKCMCGVTGSLTIGMLSAEIPHYTF